MTSEPHIRIDGASLPTRLLLFCLSVEVLLVLADAFLNYGGLVEAKPLRRMLNIAREDGLATWFMVIQTFVAGAVLGLLALLARAAGQRAVFTGWGALSAFFIYMSADDAAEIHERLGSTFKRAARGSDDAGMMTELQAMFPSYDWQLVVLPVFVIAGVLMLLFLHRQIRDNASRIMMVAAVALMGTAVSVDFVEGLDENHPWNIIEHFKVTFETSDYTASHFAKSLEEFLEMLAITLLLTVFVRKLVTQSGGLFTVRFDDSP